MKSLFAFLTFVSVLFHAAAQDSPDALRRSLEMGYQNWRAAMINGDFAAWKANTSAFRQAVTQNMITSQQQPFPEAVFAVPVTPPAVTGMRFLGVKSQGAFAQLAYWGNVKLDPTQPETVSLVMLIRFQVEQAGWKYDTTRFIETAGQPEVEAQLKAGRADFLNDPALALPPRAQPVPKITPPPDHVAVLEVNAPGATASAVFNSIPYPTVEDSSSRDLLMGGLVNGANDLTLNVSALPDAKTPASGAEVTILILPSQPGGNSRRVWTKKLPLGESKIKLNVTPAGQVTSP